MTRPPPAPGSVTYVSPGANSTPIFWLPPLAQQAGVQWNHSPNSSSPAAIAELIGGHIDAVSVNLPTFKSYTNDGSVRLLAVTGDERDPSYPDVPTFKELGYDFPASVYFCIGRPRRHRPCCCTASLRRRRHRHGKCRCAGLLY